MPVEMEQILKQMDKMPEPPKASVQAVGMLEDPAVPMAKVADFISMDECLTSKLLKLSNSASYGYSGKVTTAKEAMMRIGTNIVKASLYSSMLEASGIQMTPYFVELWKSALYCAFIARDVGEILGHPNRDVCFTAGLLSDIGQLIMNEFAPQIYPQLADKVRSNAYDLCQAEQQVFGLTHTRVGYRMAENWKLPALYQNVIKYHHDPMMAHSQVLPDDFKAIVAAHIATQLSFLFGPQNGEHIDQEALQKTNCFVPSEVIVQRISTKFDVYFQDVLMVTESMFGSVLPKA